MATAGANKKGKVSLSRTNEIAIKLPPDPTEEANKRFDKVLYIVIGVFVVQSLTLLFMVSGLLIDSFHVNSATYKEYSDKLEERNKSINDYSQQLKLNNELLKCATASSTNK